MRSNQSSLDRIIEVLLLFVRPGAALSAQQICSEYGLSRSSAYRYLSTLRKRGIIEVEPGQANSYRLSPSFIRAIETLGGGHDTIAAAAEPVMRRLASQIGETVLTTQRAGDRVVCVAYEESRQAVRVSVSLAHNTPLYKGSSAKVHLSYMDPVERDVYLKDLGKDPATAHVDLSVLKEELAQIRRQGFATSRGEIEKDVSSMSVPVLDGDGTVLAAVTLAAPVGRFSDKQEPETALVLHEAANEIKQALTKREPVIGQVIRSLSTGGA